MTAPIPRIEPLQVLRGIAALLVFSKHSLYEIDSISPIDFNYGSYEYYTIGINIFFILSGFIMVYISRGQQGAAAAKHFIINRILRITPLYWFYSFAILIVAIFIPQVLGKAEFVPIEFLKSLLFIPYLNSAGDLQPILANGWSLNYEMYFYVVFALALLLPIRYGFWIMAVYFIASVITHVFYLPNGVITQFYGRPIVLEFLMGAALGYLFVKNIRLPRFCFFIGWVFLFITLAMLLYTQTLKEILPMEYFKITASFLIICFLTLPKGSENAAMPKPLVKIGDFSYTLYLAHPFAIGATTQLILLMNWQNTIHPWVIFAIIFAVTLVGSHIAYILIEKPLLSFTKGLVYKNKRKITKV